jgi:hypothetical protein
MRTKVDSRGVSSANGVTGLDVDGELVVSGKNILLELNRLSEENKSLQSVKAMVEDLQKKIEEIREVSITAKVGVDAAEVEAIMLKMLNSGAAPASGVVSSEESAIKDTTETTKGKRTSKSQRA